MVRNEEVVRIIESLKRGDRIIVLWHDACRVTNDPDVRPEYYSTPKETQGTVYDCVPDPEYANVFYLIISGETTGGRPDYYDAIPVAWLASVQKLEASPIRKLPRRAMKVVAWTTIKRVMVYKKGRLVNDGGGVNKVPLQDMCREDEPKKLVEEIVKVVS